MKHFIRHVRLLTLLILLPGGAALAQQLHVGIKGGFNLAGMAEFRFRYGSNNLETESPDSRAGIHAGIFAEMAWPGFSIRPEINYSQKGFDFESGSARAAARLQYVDVLLLFNYRRGPMFYLLAGPQFSFMAATEYDYSGEHRDYRLKADGLDLSAMAGAGLSLGRFDLSARYGWGLVSIFRDDGIDSDRSRTAQLSAGFRIFSVNKKQ